MTLPKIRPNLPKAQSKFAIVMSPRKHFDIYSLQPAKPGNKIFGPPLGSEKQGKANPALDKSEPWDGRPCPSTVLDNNTPASLTVTPVTYLIVGWASARRRRYTPLLDPWTPLYHSDGKRAGDERLQDLVYLFGGAV